MSDLHLFNYINSLSNYDPDAVPAAQAQDILRTVVRPIEGVEQVPLSAAIDRVLAQDIFSSIDVPPHDNSAMDGYALRGADLNAINAVTLRIVATALAGSYNSRCVSPGECVRIMTGAPMPSHCDTVVPQELTQVAGDDMITIPAGAVKIGDNRRQRGEDLAVGQVAVTAGRILRPADLGLLASLGISHVPVKRRLRVAFFSTGDELRSLGEPLPPGCIYDSNRYTLYGMLTRLGCELLDMGVVRDDRAALEAALRSACENADAIITSGGVSAGDADFTRQLLEQLGEVAFWKIGMRPGRPMAFGRIASHGHSACLLALPGNPVAVMVSFYFFAREALLRMMGVKPAPLPMLRVQSKDDIRKKPGRTEYQRGILSVDAQGNRQVQLTGDQGSGVLRSMTEANCMVVLGPEQGPAQAGDMVDVVVFEGLI